MLLRLLLVAAGQFLHRKLRRLQRLGKIVVRMGGVPIFWGQIRTRTVIFFLGLQYFFFDRNDVSVMTTVVSTNVIVVATDIFIITCLV
jgi:hypothetical protein